MTAADKIVKIFAPAKINLYLHVTGRRANNYHTLDSLVCFTDIGDEITLTPENDFKFEINGPFANSLSSHDSASNLAVRAATKLAKLAQKNLNLKIALTKNLPIAAGIGGGSADAAATIWGLQDWWKLPRDARYISSLLDELGADVPVCMLCQPARILGIGEIITSAPVTQEIPIVLVNPGKPCLTAETFLRFSAPFKKEITLPRHFDDFWHFIDFLKAQNNDLYEPALQQVPEISNALTALQLQKGCALARMSGSGATCFGLYETPEEAHSAATHIHKENPDWWVKSGWLNRPERY